MVFRCRDAVPISDGFVWIQNGWILEITKQCIKAVNWLSDSQMIVKR